MEVGLISSEPRMHYHTYVVGVDLVKYSQALGKSWLGAASAGKSLH